MYFYTLSSGEYSDYHYTTIFHEKKFSREEFIDIYNQAVEIYNTNDEGIAEIMCERFGFSIIEEELEINCGYGDFEKITNVKDIIGDHKFICLDD